MTDVISKIMMEESDMPTHIWVQRNDNTDALGRCLELTKVTKSNIYYAKFDGSCTTTECLPRETVFFKDRLYHNKFFLTQWDVKEYALMILQRRIDHIKKKEEDDGWYLGYNGVA